MSSLQNMNIDIVNGVTVVEDVNLRRCRVHNKGGCGGESSVLIKSSMAAFSLPLTYMAASKRLLTFTPVSSLPSVSMVVFSMLSVSAADFFLHSMSVAALVIHGGLLEGPDPCLLDNGGLGRQIYMINSVHFNNMTTRNQEQYQHWYLEWER